MRFRGRITVLVLSAGLLAAAGPTDAQQPSLPRRVDRAMAVETALGHAARLGLARADTAAAFARLLAARARQNPVLSTGYTRSVPQYHASVDLPVDPPGLRGARVRGAQAGRQAAQLRFAAEHAAVELRADTAYTQALAARERLRLSRATAAAADSLRVIAGMRRDAGDASDLDVDLAGLNAGAQANVAATASLAYVSAVLDLQAAMGLAVDSVVIVPDGPLALPWAASSGADRAAVESAVMGAHPTAAPPLAIAAAQASLDAARFAAQAERRGVWAAPGISAGFETGDPTGAEGGILATIGLAIPLPLLDRNQGPIAQADAESVRARAELDLATLESRVDVARGRRSLAIGLERVARDEQLVAIAARVAARSITAYREGASALPSVLEAQRNARDVLARYVGDLAEAWVAYSSLRALTLTALTPNTLPR